MSARAERIRRVVLDGRTVGLAATLLGAVEVANKAGAGINPLVPAEMLGGIRVGPSAFTITSLRYATGEGPS
jgi:hypothetical protein